MRLDFGPQHGGTTGGATAFLSLSLENGWDGHYEFSTVGMTPSDVQAKVAALRVHHAKKSARMDGFASVRGTKFTIGGRGFEIVDCTLWEAAGEVELYLDVREGVLRVEGFPIIRRFRTVDDVIGDAAIVALAQAGVGDHVATSVAHADFVANVRQLIGGV